MARQLPPAPPDIKPRSPGHLDEFFGDHSAAELVGFLTQIGYHEDLDLEEQAIEAHARGEASFSDILYALHERSTQEVFDAAASLTLDPDPSNRIIGLWVIRELGSKDVGRPNFPETWDVLRNLAENEQDLDVLAWTITAYGFMHGDQVVDALVPFAAHPDREIRLLVSFNIAICAPLNDERAVEVQLENTKSDDLGIRSNAIYDFMDTITVDNERVRSMLFAALDEEDEEVRDYAVIALKARGIEISENR